MEPTDETRIAECSRKLSAPVHIAFSATGRKQDRIFVDFMDEMGRLAPLVKFETEMTDRSGRPGFKIQPNLVFNYIPLGRELEPFLQVLDVLDGTSSMISEKGCGVVSKTDIPADLKLYVAPSCPHCPTVVRQMVSAALDNPFIRLTIKDAELFFEDAQSDGIRSVPTLILDDRIRWSGMIEREEVLRIISEQNPSLMNSSSLKNLLESGDAHQVGRMMIDCNAIFPAFISLLAHEKWPVRLGAMVALETVAEENPDLAANVIDPLWKRFHTATDPAKGDILHVLGETGGSEIVEKIGKIPDGPYPKEVREAATEALEKIISKEK